MGVEYMTEVSSIVELVSLGELNAHLGSSLIEESTDILYDTTYNTTNGNIRKRRHRREGHSKSITNLVLTVAPEKLLTMPAGWEVSLSKAHVHTDHTHHRLARSTYVCSKDSNNNYSLKKAIEMPESSPVTICNKNSCNGISLGKIDDGFMHQIKDTSLMKMWS